MTTKWMYRLGIAALLLQGAGCAFHSDPDFGKAVAEARTRQIENPGAGETVQQVEGMGPGTSPDVLKNYHRNQDSAAQENRQVRQRQNGLANTNPN